MQSLVDNKFRIISNGTSQTTSVLMKDHEGKEHSIPYISRLSLSIDAASADVITPTMEFFQPEINISVSKLEEVYAKAPMGGYGCIVNTQELTPEMVEERLAEIKARLGEPALIAKIVPRVGEDKTNKGIIFENIDNRLISFEDLNTICNRLMVFQYRDHDLHMSIAYATDKSKDGINLVYIGK